MKKITAFGLAVLMILTLAACGQGRSGKTAAIRVSIDTDGYGNIAYTEGESTPEIDEDHPFQSAQISLESPATYTFLAWPPAGSAFVKWMKNGEDYSTEPQVTVLLDGNADFVAVFGEDPAWQNPVMNFIGNYQCDRARARVECFGYEDALITIDWSSSARELSRWTILGRLDTDTLTMAYTGGNRQNLVYDEKGEIVSEETVYENGTGTFVFSTDGTFTWHEDESDRGVDMIFEWVPVTAGTD